MYRIMGKSSQIKKAKGTKKEDKRKGRQGTFSYKVIQKKSSHKPFYLPGSGPVTPRLEADGIEGAASRGDL